jgi:predicted GNAT family acetyltransferase
MADSALELYDRAYTLHHVHNKADDAVCVYRKIIRHFPGSNESAYAAIQLEALGVHALCDSEKKNASNALVVLLALNMAVTAALVALVVDHAQSFTSGLARGAVMQERWNSARPSARQAYSILFPTSNTRSPSERIDSATAEPKSLFSPVSDEHTFGPEQ